MNNSGKQYGTLPLAPVKGKEPAPVRYTPPPPIAERSKEELLNLISEQRRRMEFLAAELDFFKARVIELEAISESSDFDDDWRFDVQ